MKITKIFLLALMLAVFASDTSAQQARTDSSKTETPNAEASFGISTVVVSPNPVGYSTLAEAFAGINAGTHTGAVTVSINGNTTEPATGAILNASGTGSASYTSIIISPAGGARTISGAATAGLPLIDLNGADNVTIDGLNSGGNSLTIENTTASATSGTSTVRFIGDATNNTVTNSTVLGAFNGTTATNGGTIFFSTAATGGTGNDNNTISNNNIGSSGANLPTKSIYGNGSTTTAAIGNSGISITGNNIYDFFSAAVESAGIYIGGGNTDWTINNNKFYQTAIRTQTTGNPHQAIRIASTNFNNGTINANTIGYSSSTGTGTYSLIGVSSSSKFIPIYISGHGTTTPTNITNNTITAISVSGIVGGTGTTGAFTGISYASGGSTSFTPNVTGNVIGSKTAANAITVNVNPTAAFEVRGIYYFPSSSVNLSANSVGGVAITSNSTTLAADFYGVHAFTAAAATNTINNNGIGYANAPITLTSAANGSNIFGLYCQSGNCVVGNNVVNNMTLDSPNIGTGTASSALGIWLAPSTSGTLANTISGNFVRNISNTNATAAVSVTGMVYAGTSVAGSTVERNNIQALTIPNSTSATATTTGIFINGGTTTYKNNMVSLGTEMTANSPLIYGLYENTGTDNIYHNSVYIGGAGVAAGTSNSFAFRSIVTFNTRNYRNNAFYNARSNGGATGKHYAIAVGGTGANPGGLTSNNNDLFVSGTGGFVGLYGAVDQLALADWQTATGQDAQSISANPSFLSTSNLHISAGSPLINAAPALIDVINDYDNQARPNTANLQENFGAPSVDIGADEFYAPTLASVELSGRVTTSGGNGIRNVTVYLTDSNGNTRATTTGSFGIYRFDNLPSSQTYVVTVVAKRYQFSNSTRVIELNESITDANFVADAVANRQQRSAK